MKILDIEGVRREKRFKTTKPCPKIPRHPDLVNRVFSAAAPNQLWVMDLAFVPTWHGVACVCYIIDAYSRAMVGWRRAANMKTEAVLDVIGMARRSRGRHLPELVVTAMREVKSRRFVTGNASRRSGRPPRSEGVGDSYDNALAEYTA